MQENWQAPGNNGQKDFLTDPPRIPPRLEMLLDMPPLVEVVCIPLQFFLVDESADALLDVLAVGDEVDRCGGLCHRDCRSHDFACSGGLVDSGHWTPCFRTCSERPVRTVARPGSGRPFRVASPVGVDLRDRCFGSNIFAQTTLFLNPRMV